MRAPCPLLPRVVPARLSPLAALLALACTAGCEQSDLGAHDAEGSGETGDCVTYPSATVTECPETIGENLCSEGRGHVPAGTEIEWMSNPPHSGEHYPSWGDWGDYSGGAMSLPSLPRGNWVHNMEHGGVVFTYNCPEGCAAELDVLRAVLASFEGTDMRLIITADEELPTRFAATSWTWVHTFDEPDYDELRCFAAQHFNHAPEDVP